MKTFPPQQRKLSCDIPLPYVQLDRLRKPKDSAAPLLYQHSGIGLPHRIEAGKNCACLYTRVGSLRAECPICEQLPNCSLF